MKGRQRYLCKRCGYRFTVNKPGKAIESFYVRKNLHLYIEGLGFRAIERILAVSHVSVINWVKKYAQNLSFVRIEPGKTRVVKVDELCS